MPEYLKLDADSQRMLHLLREHYGSDDGHIIRALLKDRIEAISKLKIL